MFRIKFSELPIFLKTVVGWSPPGVRIPLPPPQVIEFEHRQKCSNSDFNTQQSKPKSNISVRIFLMSFSAGYDNNRNSRLHKMRNGYKHKAVLIVVSFRVGCLTASASEPLILSSTHHSAKVLFLYSHTLENCRNLCYTFLSWSYYGNIVYLLVYFNWRYSNCITVIYNIFYT